MTESTTVTVYTREECHLCEDAIEAVRQVADAVPHEVEVDLVDVDSNPSLREAYGERVPYGLVDGRPAFKFRVDPDALRVRLLEAD